jgi:hypothetical protein
MPCSFYTFTVQSLRSVLHLPALSMMCVQEHLDFDLVKSSNSDFKGAIVRMNVFRNHRQVPGLHPACFLSMTRSDIVHSYIMQCCFCVPDRSLHKKVR